MVAPSSRRTTRAARTAASSRGREQKKKALVDAPAKKWFRVQRAPSQDCGFVVWKWKAFDDLTEDERELIFPKNESEVAVPSVNIDSSTSGTDESLCSHVIHQTPGSHAGLPTPSDDALLHQEMENGDMTTALSHSQTGTDTGEPPAKKARYEHDPVPNDAMSTSYLSQHQYYESSTSDGVSNQPLVPAEQEHPSEKTASIDTELILPDTTQVAALDTSMDIESEPEPSNLTSETPNQAIAVAALMELEPGTAVSGIVSSDVYQTAVAAEETLVVPSADEGKLQTTSEAAIGTVSELKEQPAIQTSGSASPTQTDLAPADQSAMPPKTDLSDLNDAATASQVEYAESEAPSTGTTPSDVVKQHIAESEAAVALSSLADIFASESTVPENM